MTSSVMICNMALAALGTQDFLESLDEQSSFAPICRLHYDSARRQLLEQFDWQFARVSVDLALHDVPPPKRRWAFRYQRPSDCLNPRYIEHPGGRFAMPPIAFRSESAGDGTLCILTNMPEAVLLYTRDETAADLFSSSFIRSLSFLISMLIAPSVTQDERVANRVTNSFGLWQQVAEYVDATELMPDSPKQADWINARS